MEEAAAPSMEELFLRPEAILLRLSSSESLLVLVLRRLLGARFFLDVSRAFHSLIDKCAIRRSYGEDSRQVFSDGGDESREQADEQEDQDVYPQFAERAA